MLSLYVVNAIVIHKRSININKKAKNKITSIIILNTCWTKIKLCKCERAL